MKVKVKANKCPQQRSFPTGFVKNCPSALVAAIVAVAFMTARLHSWTEHQIFIWRCYSTPILWEINTHFWIPYSLLIGRADKVGGLTQVWSWCKCHSFWILPVVSGDMHSVPCKSRPPVLKDQALLALTVAFSIAIANISCLFAEFTKGILHLS